ANKEVKEIFSNPDYDMSGIEYDRQKNVLVNVSWNADRMEEHYFDKEWETVHNDLKSKFKDYDIGITSHDNKRTKAIVWTGNDRLPAKYYLYDFASHKTEEIANAYPWLKEDDLAYMKPISYKTRDGLTVHGYLTLPKGVDAKNLPVVV